MLTALTDLLFTSSAIGLLGIVAGLGVAVLPWRRQEVEEVEDAMNAAVRLPGAMARAALSPSPVHAPALLR